MHRISLPGPAVPSRPGWAAAPAPGLPRPGDFPGPPGPYGPAVPAFAPVRPRGGRHRLRRILRRRRGPLAALALAAAALALALPPGLPRGGPGPGGAEAAAAAREGPAPRTAGASRAAELVAAPVRIADAGAARLLRPGDRVDVLAAAREGDGRTPPEARVVARRARVAEVPAGAGAPGPDGSLPDVDGGALVVLTVPPQAAARLAGAAAVAELAVVRW
ncbi:RcpC/CpaB family pilus assembly protein [Streptomyces sp. DSM 44917]|uniref:RcpC/CpaB family pilus assembly protein n=1 Tax=Streptomyces boetiae TaxID=3075541 RepID=A0ABU2LCT1_9ACTN|nr:RcpC/CpaB family pilus assembly protein [Streptomyces sp. DSM 44917]MDT0309327.1 RcpC/CpaB family pilus assembly protein [Streptomyces sp. DSM 44917]